MSLIRKHVAVLQAWACLDLVDIAYHRHFPAAKWDISLRRCINNVNRVVRIVKSPHKHDDIACIIVRYRIHLTL